jgi:nucleotide-binding universal stress UspA family protein
MSTFTKIVVAMDGSDTAANALPYAAQLARDNDASIVMAHVDQWIAAKGGGELVANEDEVQAKLAERAAALSDEGIPTSVESAASMASNPAHQIADIAQKADADLIVVGTRGDAPLKSVIVGSVTHRMLHLAQCPVLVVPPAAHLKEIAEPSAAAAVAA